MDIYDTLLRWAADQGIELHGISPQQIAGRGIGLVATRPLQKSSTLLTVPTSCLRTLNTVPYRIRQPFPKDAPVHGVLAASLALDALAPNPHFTAWNAVVPSRASLLSSLPIAWPSALLPFLPQPALDLLAKQSANFARDWALFQAHPLFPRAGVTPSITRIDYLYHWLLVNTRTFYHDLSWSTSTRLPAGDRMALQPVADLFNHADAGCGVAFDEEQFIISADRDYDEGEELFISYGAHGNDFLLVEYGFVLERNRWDEVELDEVLLPELTKRQKGLLEEKGFLGNYVLDAETECFRTQVAVRLLSMPLVRDWERFVDEEEEGSEEVQRRADRILVGILRTFLDKVWAVKAELEEVTTGEEGQREMLMNRWRQIEGLLEATIRRLEIK
ncbi:hypothetical protein B0T18DRAFT_437070 [Schizothecium vesticola]|uniref:SET domain-containing protein n=1 Tax=Schizothecium vesticola TaxID=314040 RepID=A0AA40K862_9PEZI|nr:hypothetical protein B0T18DRAFT_437070 [Schizothecium vesticola]